ncbi:MAG TPA: RsmE family RNA methyltransferase [Verrucomicrobiae bacterium]|nr:RsmE family RNA methyltransferase [Verrucomicrobiae bacterium]
MQTHRFYLPPEHCRGDVLRLEGREAHHALGVLRLRRGDEVMVLDGAGNRFICRAGDPLHRALPLHVERKLTAAPPPCALTLLVGLPKGKIIESLISKAVELGAHRVVPLLTERVVTRLEEPDRARKQAHWRQVAVEAIKQCGAAWLPEIEAPVAIQEFLRAAAPGTAAVTPRSDSRGSWPKTGAPFELSLVGALQTERRHPREVFREFEKVHGRLPKTAAAWIGPEGDFTPEELRRIQDAGAQPVSLGPLTLRVETAAIYCLSVLHYEFNSAAGMNR